MCRSACSVAVRAGRRAGPLEHPVRRVVGQRPERAPQRPPQRLPVAPWHHAVHLQLIQAQPHERVSRGGQLLQCPAALADHGDQLPPRICPAPGCRQQLRRPRPGRDIKRDQRPVPVRRQRREDLVELLVRDTARDPGGHHRPVQAGALPAERLHRVVVRMRPPATARPVQRERVNQRARARLQVKAVKAAQHRFAMRPHRGRISQA